MLSNKIEKLTDKQIVEKGSRILIKELGYSGFLRFIRQTEYSSKEDYLNLEEELFLDKSIDDILGEAKDYWEYRANK